MPELVIEACRTSRAGLRVEMRFEHVWCTSMLGRPRLDQSRTQFVIRLPHVALVTNLKKLEAAPTY